VLKAAKQATGTIPIVMIAINYDPVALGYVGSLARPGGNITGVFLRQPELTSPRRARPAPTAPPMTPSTPVSCRTSFTDSGTWLERRLRRPPRLSGGSRQDDIARSACQLGPPLRSERADDCGLLHARKWKTTFRDFARRNGRKCGSH
jgi:hypothetical protein